MKRFLFPVFLIAPSLCLLLPLSWPGFLLPPVLVLLLAWAVASRGGPPFGLVVLGSLFVLALCGTLIAPYGPHQVFASGEGHLLGLDVVGRDLYSRMLYGHRNTMVIAAAGSALGTLIGICSGGVISLVERRGLRVTKIMFQVYLSVPPLLYFLLGLCFLKPGISTMIILLGITSWPELARLLQAQVGYLRKADFALAARMRGMSEWRIFFSEIIPNLTHLVWAHFLITLASSMIMESSLTYLGLGSPLGTPSLGRLLADGIQHIEERPSVFLIGISLFLGWIISLRAFIRRYGRAHEVL